jgi:thiol-disulfide isomerase/thioredoxin
VSLPSGGSPLAAARAALGGLLLALAVGACDDDGDQRPPPTRERSDSIVGKSKSSGSSAATASASASASKPRKPRKLCEGKPPDGKPPKGPIPIAKAAGAGSLPNPIPFGVGKWVWVNLWAVWCEPCKEEMPRLRKWHAELRKAGVLIDLAFVSLDDDERQLQRFLNGEPKSGLRVSYWLKEDIREGWLQPFGIKPEAQLPVHLLVNPQGEIACVINGVVEEEDYPGLAKLIKGG